MSQFCCFYVQKEFALTSQDSRQAEWKVGFEMGHKGNEIYIHTEDYCKPKPCRKELSSWGLPGPWGAFMASILPSGRHQVRSSASFLPKEPSSTHFMPISWVPGTLRNHFGGCS